jgi:site-specific DNA-methyltransferase (adenine-specific)
MFKIIMDNIFGMENFRNEIVWHYVSPGNFKNHFGRKHDIIFFYSKGDNYIFNSDDVRTAYGIWTKGKKEYKTKSYGLKKSVTIELNPAGKLCDDVWNINMISSTSKERTGYPTQKPLELLKRIIKASSNGEVFDV